MVPIRFKIRHIDIAFIVALLLLTMTLIVLYHIKNELVDSNRWTTHTYQVLTSLDDLKTSLLEAESCRRAYVLTGNIQLKRQYLLNEANVPEALRRVTALTRDDHFQQRRLQSLRNLIQRKLSDLSASINAMDNEGYQKEIQSQITEEGALLMSLITSGMDDLKRHEENLLAERQKAQLGTLSFLRLVSWLGILLAMAILILAYYLSRLEANIRKKTAGALEAANADINNLSEMTQFLQSCSSMAEAGEVLQRYAARFFHNNFGGIYLLNSSRDLLVEAATWGEFHSDIFKPDQCWALRRGQPHLVRGAADLKCDHVVTLAQGYICLPLAAYHETLGVLHLGITAPEAVADINKTRQLVVAFSEQVALALRNLQLHEQLRELSIRDPLTGLLNRRYMEDTLSREVSRSFRNKLPLSVIMMDVDFFKKFNDTFGHEAGDLVLKEFGSLLQQHVRKSDIACRFGGEEFTVILPETTIVAAIKEADVLREAVKQLALTHNKRSLGVITISAGVAVYPEDGKTPQQLLAAADAALYRAKENGRDRVESFLPR